MGMYHTTSHRRRPRPRPRPSAMMSLVFLRASLWRCFITLFIICEFLLLTTTTTTGGGGGGGGAVAAAVVDVVWPEQHLWLDGRDGRDTNTGTSREQPLQSFKKVNEIASAQWNKYTCTPQQPRVRFYIHIRVGVYFPDSSDNFNAIIPPSLPCLFVEIHFSAYVSTNTAVGGTVGDNDSDTGDISIPRQNYEHEDALGAYNQNRRLRTIAIDDKTKRGKRMDAQIQHSIDAQLSDDDAARRYVVLDGRRYPGDVVDVEGIITIRVHPFVTGVFTAGGVRRGPNQGWWNIHAHNSKVRDRSGRWRTRFTTVHLHGIMFRHFINVGSVVRLEIDKKPSRRCYDPRYTSCVHLAMTDCVFAHNYAKRPGVATYVKNGIAKLDVTRMTCYNNSNYDNISTKSQLKAYSWGGCMAIGYYNRGVNVRNSYFSLNTAINGGGICSSSSTSVQHSGFYWNRAIHEFEGGAAVYVEDEQTYDTKLNITDSWMLKNIATGGGGAVSSFAMWTEISRTLFKFNMARVYGYGQGGAVWVVLNVHDNGETRRPHVLIDESLFLENRVLKYGGFSQPGPAQGGAVFVTYQDKLETSYANYLVDIRRTKFLYNEVIQHSTVSQGGAVFVNGQTLVIDSSEFVGNTAMSGGGVFAQGSKVKVTNSLFRGHGDIGGEYVPREGALLMMSSSRLVVDNANFTEGVSNLAGVMMIGDGSHAVIRRTYMTDSRAIESGGAIYVDVGSSLVLSDSMLTSCQARQGGGAIFSKGHLQLYDTTIGRCHALEGGAIQTYGGIIVRRSHFHDCRSSINGGAVSLYLTPAKIQRDGKVDVVGSIPTTRGIAKDENIKFTDCLIFETRFEANIAGSDGGAVSVTVPAADKIGSVPLNYRQSNRHNNSSTTILYPSVYFDDLKFYKNSCFGDGGAVAVIVTTSVQMLSQMGVGGVGSMQILQGIAVDNDTDAYETLHSHDFVLSSCSFYENHAAVHGAGVAINGRVDVDFRHSSFARNTHLPFGRRVYGVYHLPGNRIEDDAKVSLLGGAIAALDGARITLNATKLWQNIALEGAGVYLDGSKCSVFRNSRIYTNFAFHNGGGVAARGSMLEIRDSSIFDNRAALHGGAGIHTELTAVFLHRVNLYTNRCGKLPKNISVIRLTDREPSTSSTFSSAVFGVAHSAETGALQVAVASSQHGGGAQVLQSSVLIMHECQVWGNAATNGGGIAARADSFIAISSSLFSRNHATTSLLANDDDDDNVESRGGSSSDRPDTMESDTGDKTRVNTKFSSSTSTSTSASASASTSTSTSTPTSVPPRAPAAGFQAFGGAVFVSQSKFCFESLSTALSSPVWSSSPRLRSQSQRRAREWHTSAFFSGDDNSDNGYLQFLQSNGTLMSRNTADVGGAVFFTQGSGGSLGTKKGGEMGTFDRFLSLVGDRWGSEIVPPLRACHRRRRSLFQNVLLASNVANVGAGMYLRRSEVELTNLKIENCTASSGSAVFTDSASARSGQLILAPPTTLVSQPKAAAEGETTRRRLSTTTTVGVEGLSPSSGNDEIADALERHLGIVLRDNHGATVSSFAERLIARAGSCNELQDGRLFDDQNNDRQGKPVAPSPSSTTGNNGDEARLYFRVYDDAWDELVAVRKHEIVDLGVVKQDATAMSFIMQVVDVFDQTVHAVSLGLEREMSSSTSQQQSEVSGAGATSHEANGAQQRRRRTFVSLDKLYPIDAAATSENQRRSIQNTYDFQSIGPTIKIMDSGSACFDHLRFQSRQKPHSIYLRFTAQLDVRTISSPVFRLYITGTIDTTVYDTIAFCIGGGLCFFALLIVIHHSQSRKRADDETRSSIPSTAYAAKQLLIAFWAVFDGVTDILFCIIAKRLTDEGDISAWIFPCALVTVLFCWCINGVVVSAVLLGQEGFTKHYFTYSVAMAPILFLCLFHPQSANLLSSNIAGLGVLRAPLSFAARTKFKTTFSLVPTVLENIPQLIIQLIVLRQAPTLVTTLQMVSVVSTSFTLLMTLVTKLLGSVLVLRDSQELKSVSTIDNFAVAVDRRDRQRSLSNMHRQSSRRDSMGDRIRNSGIGMSVRRLHSRQNSVDIMADEEANEQQKRERRNQSFSTPFTRNSAIFSAPPSQRGSNLDETNDDDDDSDEGNAVPWTDIGNQGVDFQIPDDLNLEEGGGSSDMDTSDLLDDEI